MTALPLQSSQDKAIEAYKQGMSDAEVMEILGVSRKFFEKRYKDDPNFMDFVDMGRTLSEAWWMRQGREGVNNTKFNTNLWTFIVKNRFDWAEKLDTRSAGGTTSDMQAIKKQIVGLMRSKGAELDLNNATDAQVFQLLNTGGASN